MSWRFLFVLLVLAAGGAVVGGIELGDWLIAHAPESIAQASSGSPKTEVVLDANGKPFTPQPPQPRIDGTLGVPRELAPVEWTITAVTALDIPREENATQVGDDEPRELPAAGTGLASAPGDVATVDVTSGRPPATTGNAPAPAATAPASGSQPARAGNAPQRPPAAPVAPAGGQDWQQTLRREIEICGNLGFFQRPSCVQNARNRICTPNDGWGKVPECPPRTYDKPGA